MANTEIRIPGLPSGLTVSCVVRNPDTLAVLETVSSMTETSGYYAGDVTGSHAGRLVFEPRIDAVPVGAITRTIADDVGPYVIIDSLDLPAVGAGPYVITVTVQDHLSADLEGAQVTAIEGATRRQGTTDSNGEVVLYLDAATWSVVVSKTGYPQHTATLVVSATASVTYQLAASTITPPSTPALATGVMTVLDELAAIEADVDVSVQLKSGPGTAGNALDTAIRTETSSGTGYVEFTDLIRGATYYIWRGGASSNPAANNGGFGQRPGSATEFVVPDAASFNLPEIQGAE